VIALIVLPCLFLITLDVRGNSVVDRGRSAFARVLSPFDTAARAISNPIVDTWRGVNDYDRVRRENEQLREQLQHQTGDDIQARAAILEYQQILALNQLTATSGIPTLTARVVGNAPGNFQNTIEIDRGSDRGVAVGMPVTNGAGIVGKVTKVFADHSLVLLISDPQYSVSAKVLTPDPNAPTTTTTTIATDGTTPSGVPAADLTSTTSTTTTSTTTTVPRSRGATTTTSSTTSTVAGTDTGTTSTTVAAAAVGRETGGLQGNGFGRPLLLRFVEDSSIRGGLTVGSPVLTAGGASSLAPPGLNIGVISKISKDLGSSSPVVEVQPAADLNSLDFVTVVLYSPNPAAGGR
jgi:rod shape-determining protein MreC